MKKCGCCKEDLSLDSFQKDSRALDGLQNRCRRCTKKASKDCRDKRGHLWLSAINPWRTRNSENRIRSNASARSRRALNPEKIRKKNRDFRERHPFSVAVLVANGRAKKLGVISTLTTEEWRSVVEINNFICHICRDLISLEIGSPNRLSLDHVISMSRGGENIKENVLPAHRRCNQIRNDMTLEEFDVWLDKVYLSRRSGHGEST